MSSCSKAGCLPYAVYLFPVKGFEWDGLQSGYLPEIRCLEIQLTSRVAFVQATWEPTFVHGAEYPEAYSSGFCSHSHSFLQFICNCCFLKPALFQLHPQEETFLVIWMLEPVRKAELLYFQTLGWPWMVSTLPNSKCVFSLICKHFVTVCVQRTWCLRTRLAENNTA